jgi:uncharacterized protein YjbI with pentapeptide repeats
VADRKQVEILKKGVAKWNAWRRSVSKVPDLTGAKLSGAILSHAVLSGANLSGANLSRANLTDATLSMVDAQKQLDQACGTDAKLPPGLTLKPCPWPPLNRRTTP